VASRKKSSQDHNASSTTRTNRKSVAKTPGKSHPVSKNPVSKERKTVQRKSAGTKSGQLLRLPPGIEIKICEYGRGIFVTKPFTAEAVVGEVTGEIIKTADYGSQNCMDLGRHGVLEPNPPFQFLNHSCEPNCELLWELDDDPKTGKRRPRVYVQTLRAIAIGDQLTLEYAWPADEAIPCQCRSPQCRGWVVAAEELHLIPETLAV